MINVRTWIRGGGSAFWIVVIFMLGAASAQPPVSGPIHAGKGTLSDSGKFLPPLPPAGVVSPVPDPATRLAELGVKLEGDQVRIGLVELDRKSRTVTIPAKVHAVQGVIEYLLVHSTGKVHETLFVTEALPRDIHVACLLAGWAAKGANPTSPEIEVSATWETNGPARQEPVENLVAFAKGSPQGETCGHLASGPWSYSGSVIDAAGFAATREGSIISLIGDPAALVTNPRSDRKDDTIHVPNATQLPPAGVPVKIVFRALKTAAP